MSAQGVRNPSATRPIAPRRLVEAIILTPENGALRIDLKGELAGILAMAQKTTAAGEVASGRLAEQIKMVAGTGSQQYRTLAAIDLARV